MTRKRCKKLLMGYGFPAREFDDAFGRCKKKGIYDFNWKETFLNVFECLINKGFVEPVFLPGGSIVFHWEPVKKSDILRKECEQDG